MKYIITLLVAVGFGISVMAQTKAETPGPAIKKYTFSSTNNLSFLSGGTGQNAAVETINGIRYKSYHFGIGTGIDWYGVRSIPLFADVRKTFTEKKNKPFVYAGSGINFAWDNGYSNGYYLGFSSTSVGVSYQNGFYGQAGVGYQIQLKNQTSFLFSAGFSYKEIKSSQTWESGVPGFAKTTTNFEYYYRRIAVKMGISF